jgi:hypothetical protein
MEFRPSNTTYLFAENFREVHFVWSPSVDYSYIARADATLVLTELAERFMVSLPDDQFNLLAAEWRQAHRESMPG